MSTEAIQANGAPPRHLPAIEAQSVPSGYKRTEVGVIPKEWGTSPLVDVAECLDNRRVPLNEAQRSQMQGDIPYCGANGVLDYVNDFVVDDDIILIAEDGGYFDEYASRPIAYRMKGKCWVNNHAHILKARRGHDQGFLFYSLVHKNILPFLAIGTRAKLNKSEMWKILVQVPPSESEQRTIAETLSDVDGLVEALGSLIAKKQSIKQAAMQQLLTGKTRLPGFSGEWETKRLREIASITMGRTPSRANAAFWGHGHVWLSIADLKGKIVCESKEQITDLAAATMTPIAKGTLLMSFKLSIGRLCFAGCDLFTNEAICSFTDLDADADFLYYALSRTDFSLYGKQAVKGYTLNSESLKQVELSLPGRTEQTAIATVLSDMDAEIAALEVRRDKIRAIKQGMMQQLLTGRVRLVEPSPAEAGA